MQTQYIRKTDAAPRPNYTRKGSQNRCSIAGEPSCLTGRARGRREFFKVWRLAERECIDLAAGRAAKGYKRLPAERRAAVIEARRTNPEATQAEIARATGVSRPTVTRIDDGRRRKLAAAKAE
jgi:hypothetical protein